MVISVNTPANHGRGGGYWRGGAGGAQLDGGCHYPRTALAVKGLEAGSTLEQLARVAPQRLQTGGFRALVGNYVKFLGEYTFFLKYSLENEIFLDNLKFFVPIFSNFD